MLGDSKVNAVVPTHDLATARRFYEDTLGAKILEEEGPDAIRFECGMGSEFLLYQTVVPIPAEHTIMWFQVTDVEATVVDLESRGVRFEEYDLAAMGYQGVAAGKAKILTFEDNATAFFKDPEGNIIAVSS